MFDMTNQCIALTIWRANVSVAIWMSLQKFDKFALADSISKSVKVRETGAPCYGVPGSERHTA